VTQPARPSAFANLLKCQRVALHLTQEALAERAGLSARAISDLERGINHQPHADTLRRLMDGLALSEPDRAALVAAAHRHGEYAYCLLAGCVAPAPTEPAAILVGRADELALLGQHVRGAGPPVLLLAGAPGSGVSRLLEVAAAGAAGCGLRALVGACHQFGEDALEPLLRALAAYARTQSGAQLRRDLRGCERMVRLLPHLAEAYAEPLPPITDSPEQERRLTHDAVARFLANIAGPAGTLLVLDDLQWAAFDALHLLAALARAGPQPVRVVAGCAAVALAEDAALARFASDLARGGLAATHVVPRLDDDASLRLVRLHLAAGAAPPVEDADLRAAVARCGGAPAALVRLAGELSGAGPAAGGAPAAVAEETTPPGLAAFEASLGVAPSAAPLLGRERDVAAVMELLRQDGVRLVTLSGPGGIGKTRLATRVAAGLRDLAPDGVYVVPLAPLRDAALLPAAIARALDLRERAHQPHQVLVTRRLSGRRALLVLDNFEHVLGAAELVARLVNACPRLKVLVTSRAPLRVAGEREYRVPALAYPAPEQLAMPAGLARFAAVDLFARRATLAQPDFRVTPANAVAVAAICARLDGLPLAIELAAARVALLPPAALLARLTGALAGPPLGVLGGGAPDAPERLQTMRGAIAWSYDLLSPQAQQAFRRLAVCAGGCTVAAAEAICQDDETMLDALTELTAHSLLRTEEQPDGEVRLTMLATIHSFAQECLAASDEAGAMGRRHADYYATVAEVAESDYAGPRQLIYLARWQREQENLRAALHWAAEAGETVLGLRLAAALWDHWVVSGQLSEGRGWLERLLAREAASQADRAPPALRARALNGAALIAWHLGDFRQAEARIRESIMLYGSMADERGACRALNTLGLALHAQGEDARALDVFTECLRLARSLDDPARIGLALSNLADVWADRHDYARAAALLEECLSRFRQIGAPTLISYALQSLGNVLFQLGARERAAQVLRESLASIRATRTRLHAADALELAGLIAITRERMADAVRVFGAAAALRAADGTAMAAQRQASVQRALESARVALAAAEFTAAWDQGAALRLDAALERALAVVTPIEVVC
jgi:non-specific serine/threonine protein kinase